MNRIYFLALNTTEAHHIAAVMGFNRGQYIVVNDRDRIRGIRRETAYVVGHAEQREDYQLIISEMLMSDFIIVTIDDEILDMIVG